MFMADGNGRLFQIGLEVEDDEHRVILLDIETAGLTFDHEAVLYIPLPSLPVHEAGRRMH